MGTGVEEVMVADLFAADAAAGIGAFGEAMAAAGIDVGVAGVGAAAAAGDSIAASIGADTVAGGLAEGAAGAVGAGELIDAGTGAVAGDAGAAGGVAGADAAGAIGATELGAAGADVAGSTAINQAVNGAVNGAADTVSGPQIVNTGTDTLGTGPQFTVDHVATTPELSTAIDGANAAADKVDSFFPEWMLDKTGKLGPAGLIAGQMGLGLMQGAGAAVGATRAAELNNQGAMARIQAQADTNLAQSKAGTYSGGVRVKPVAGAVLRYDSTGKPVYSNGLIAGRGI